MKKPHHVLNEKMCIVTESINTCITLAELCRRHNINPVSFTRWRDIFFEWGKVELKKP